MNITDISDLVPTLRWALLVFNTGVHIVEGKCLGGVNVLGDSEVWCSLTGRPLEAGSLL